MSENPDALTEEQKSNIMASIDRRSKELEEAYMNVLIQSAPVFQCADALKKSIDEITSAIDSEDFDLAADLGYRDFCSNFVWMQRTLGAMHDAAMKCSEAIVEVACDAGLTHAQVNPLVCEFFVKVRGPRGKEITGKEAKSELNESLTRLRSDQSPQ